MGERRIVAEEDLMFGHKGRLYRLLARGLMSFLGLNKANRIYDRTYSFGEGYAGRLLEAMDISYRIDAKDLSNIPWSGALIVVSNHPTGGMDGIVLIDALSKIRPDVRFMGNFLLDRIEPLRRYCIPVDPFDGPQRSKNVRGIKASVEHLRAGGVLGIFPAGEVATWRHGFKNVSDKPWDPAVVRFIRKANVPVLPVYIDSRNSLFFRLAGKIHPMLRTALLPHELFNKKGKTVNVAVGSAIPPCRLEALDAPETYGNYLRASVDYLRGSRSRKSGSGPHSAQDTCDIVSRPPLEALSDELEELRSKGMRLFDYGSFEVFCAHPASIPSLMREIGRMREITFREAGEGTMKEVDTDQFDTYYHQLFVWDGSTECLVGAYRLGFGDEIVPRYGLHGFYTDSLFRYDPGMIPILEKTVELGRSFVTRDYQRKAAPLMLLWKGILYVLLRNRQYRYLLGPVTVSGEYSRISKTVIAAYLGEHYADPELSRFVRPVTGLKGIDAPIDSSLVRGVESIDLINRIVSDIEQDERGIPVLMRKYLQLNSHVLGFNVDPDFCDGMDALMLLDLMRVPEKTINMLSKELTDIDVLARFKNIN